MALQMNYFAAANDVEVIAADMFEVFGEFILADECSQVPEIEWSTVTDQTAIKGLLHGNGGYITTPQHRWEAVRRERVLRGYPIDRNSAPFIEVTPTGIVLEDVARCGRLYLYDCGDESMKQLFARLLRRMKSKAEPLPTDKRFWIFPCAKASARWLASTTSAPPRPSPFAR